jgi:hypothetical protein
MVHGELVINAENLGVIHMMQVLQTCRNQEYGIMEGFTQIAKVDLGRQAMCVRA